MEILKLKKYDIFDHIILLHTLKYLTINSPGLIISITSMILIVISIFRDYIFREKTIPHSTSSEVSI